VSGDCKDFTKWRTERIWRTRDWGGEVNIHGMEHMEMRKLKKRERKEA
jgi:hypothetical protein